MSSSITFYYWNSPNYSLTDQGNSEGYGAVNVRLKFCQLENSGSHRNKRYLKTLTPIQCRLPHCTDHKLVSSASDMMNSGDAQISLKRYDSSTTYSPYDTNQDIVMNKTGHNMSAGDIFLSVTSGPNFSSGYEQFKIYRPTLVYRLMGLRR